MSAGGNLPGVILAGGLSRRMGGGDKTLLTLGDHPVLQHVIERVRPQVSSLALNANGEPERFAPFGLPVLRDTVRGRPGPLAGILAAMRWGAEQGAGRVLTVPADTPFLPLDLASRLREHSSDGAAIARAGGRNQPTCAVWPTGAADDLQAFLDNGDERKIMVFADRLGCTRVPFEDMAGFFNINTPDDLSEALELAR